LYKRNKKEGGYKMVTRIPCERENFESVINEYESRGMFLIHTEILTEGSFLTFSDEPLRPQAYAPTPEERLEALEFALLDLLFSGGASK
jgi:hypothetical protein